MKLIVVFFNLLNLIDWIELIDSGNESQSPPGMGPPKTSSPLSYNNASQNSLLSLANSGGGTPASSPYGKHHHSHLHQSGKSPRSQQQQRRRLDKDGSKDNNNDDGDDGDDDDDEDEDDDDSLNGRNGGSGAGGGAATAGDLSSMAGFHLPSAFSNALGGLSALASGLAAGAAAAGAGSAGVHPPLTPSPSSDSPQQQDAPRAPNSSQQSWTFEEQFKQVRHLLYTIIEFRIKLGSLSWSNWIKY